jgi:hypothetical protein
METCAYKQLRFYSERCDDCNGRDDKMCYVTHKQLILHLKDFEDIFKQPVKKDLGRLEEFCI